jgi:Rrf2 family nitric oxide-sensitive transcriptional repressor
MYFKFIFRKHAPSIAAMRLTTFTDYTLRVLMYLGTRSDRTRLITIGDIATAYTISENHLTKVVHLLAKRGYIKTTRGRHGGMQLARTPEQINIGEVVRRTEDNLAPKECPDPCSPDCRILAVCKMHDILAQAIRAFYGVLDNYTLADLVRTPGNLATIFSTGDQPPSEPRL